MANATGTASSHKDLLDKLKIFLTTNAALVAASQEWTVNRFYQGDAIRYLDSSHYSTFERFDAFDHDPQTWWAPNGSTGQLSIQFAAAYAISYIHMTVDSILPGGFTIDYSDNGTDWTTAKTYSETWANYETKILTTDVVVGETHAHWRLNITDGNNYPRIAMLKMFEFGDTSYAVDLAGEDELIIEGPGLSGTEEIYVGIRTYGDIDADYHNFSFNSFVGYVAGNSFNTQPGRRDDNSMSPMWDDSIPYYFRANGQSVTVLAKIETVYVLLHAGKFYPYATPGQYPIPLVLCGMYDNDTQLRYDDEALEIQTKTGVPIRFVDGLWKDVDIWPVMNHGAYGPDDAANYPFSSYAWRDTEATYPAVQMILHDADGVYGEFDGLYFVSGFNNAVENTMTVGSDAHIIWRNLDATGFDDYYSLELT